MDKSAMKAALVSYKRNAVPTNPSPSAPASVQDVQNVVSETAKLIRKLIQLLDD